LWTSQIRVADGLKLALDSGPKRNVFVPQMRMDIIGVIGSPLPVITIANYYGPQKNQNQDAVLEVPCIPRKSVMTT
jgi:hypothetical protein